MEANRVESEKCIFMANQHAYKNEYENAIKFIEKSLKLYPTELAKSKMFL